MSSSRVPVVSRLEYIFDFLHGLQTRSDRAALESKLAERKRQFEVEKYRALGRGNPLMKKLSRAANLLDHCETMAARMGLTEGAPEPKLTEDGMRLMSLPDDERRDAFATRFLATFSASRTFLLLLNGRFDHEILFPTEHVRTAGARFVDIAKPMGLSVDVVSFVVIREILSQSGLINWHPVREGMPQWRLYLACEISSGESSIGGLTFSHETKTYGLRRTQPPYTNIREVLWEEYMERTHDVPFRPIFYSDLRTAVCYRLKMSDQVFDSFASDFLQNRDKNYEVVWSAGSLPYNRDSASLLKSLPPKMEDEEYVIYLKIERRRAN